MGVDLSRVANKALEAALEDADNSRSKHSGLKTLAAGAALAVAARAAISKAPGLVHMPDLSALRHVPDRVRDRLADVGWLDDDDEDAEEPVDEAQEFDEPDDEELDEDEEPVAEGDEEDEDFDEEDEEPVDEEDEDFDDEDEDEEPDEEPAPELELESEDDEDLHPEDRPPKPPRSKAEAR